ncbi:MAG TPA: helix-turn-helix transcriptional regulator [Pyrinomonadaceae bacterium]|nr:helix-turn-helix transcriptional regulator [Pyrinomonadaceae bacterium]
MGRRARYIPTRLPEKLIAIRRTLNLTQQEMLKRLDLPEEILQTSISQYEKGKIEPPIFVLLRYAEVANVWVEVLLKDTLDLPEALPSPVKHEGVSRKPSKKKV